MLGLKINHVSKRGHGALSKLIVFLFIIPQIPQRDKLSNWHFSRHADADAFIRKSTLDIIVCGVFSILIQGSLG